MPSVFPLRSLADLNSDRVMSACVEPSIKLATTLTGKPRIAARTTEPKIIV